MKLALFDCDGTLVDSAGLIHETMRRTFDKFGRPEPRFEDT
ncbi:HAD family hydrolase, partial [Rhizobium ruizarguesonis]